MLSIRKRMAANAVYLTLMPVVLAVFIMATATGSLAHRVNIFAWTEGDQVVAECGFNGGNKVKQGQIVVFDAATGAKLLEALTDDSGVIRFPIYAEGKAHGLRIVIKAGEGHQNEWTMEAAELTASQPVATAPSAASSPASATPFQTDQKPQKAPAQQAASATTAGTANISAAELQNIVNTALDVKLGPIRKELAEMRVARPGFSEIFGGIGWLVGLAGVALYFKGRRG